MSDSTYGDELADVFASFAVGKNPTGLSLGIDSAWDLGDHIASTWLTEHDAKLRAETLREAADDDSLFVATDDLPTSFNDGVNHAADDLVRQLRERADRIEKEAGLT